MTVEQLIMHLQSFPPKAPVVVVDRSLPAQIVLEVDHVRYQPEPGAVVLE